MTAPGSIAHRTSPLGSPPPQAPPLRRTAPRAASDRFERAAPGPGPAGLGAKPEHSEAGETSAGLRPPPAPGPAAPGLAAELQANLRQAAQDQSARRAGATVAVSAEAGNSSEGELRALFREKVMPGVRAGLGAMGARVSESRCELASAMTLRALEELGVKGARIVEGNGHVFVEVKTKEGKTLTLDPTLAQFTRAGSPIHRRLEREGFIGTRDELTETIHEHVHDFNLGNDRNLRLKGAYDDQDLYRRLRDGAPIAGFSDPRDPELAAQRANVAEYRRDLLGAHHYPERPTSRYAPTAQGTLAWWRGGGRGERVTVGIGADGARVQKDRTADYRAAFEALERSLGAAPPRPEALAVRGR